MAKVFTQKRNLESNPWKQALHWYTTGLWNSSVVNMKLNLWDWTQNSCTQWHQTNPQHCPERWEMFFLVFFKLTHNLLCIKCVLYILKQCEIHALTHLPSICLFIFHASERCRQASQSKGFPVIFLLWAYHYFNEMVRLFNGCGFAEYVCFSFQEVMSIKKKKHGE